LPADSTLFFQFGIIMLLAFIGAGISARLGQSVILGYMLVGIMIGPYMKFSILGFSYSGLIQNTTLLSYFAQMGLVLLLFFVGLEFSISKLKKTKTAATILAIFNLGMDMFLAILLGVLMRWPMEDVFFLGAIIATGSSAVAAKGLMDIGKLSAPETEFIIGMSVVEDFIAMLLLTVAGGLTARSTGGPGSLWQLMAYVGAFYLFFVLLAIVIIPRVLKHIEVIKNDEMFILFALGIVFISVALADALYVQSLIGAFFIGMVFAETTMTERLKNNLMSMRDAFVAIFFVYFGMLINPAVLVQVLPLIVIAVPLMLFSDIILTSSVAMLIGFPARHSVFVGASSTFRGAESMLFASVGANSMGVSYAEQLYAVAGPFSLIMDLIALPVLKKSASITVKLSRIVPAYVKFSASLISRTFSKLVMPQSLQIYGNARKTTLPLWGFILSSAVAIFVSYPLKGIPLAVAGVSTFLSLSILRKDLVSSINLINYTNIGVGSRGSAGILSLVMKLVSGLMLSVMGVIALAGIYVPLSLIPVGIYALYMLKTMHTAYTQMGTKNRIPVSESATFGGGLTHTSGQQSTRHSTGRFEMMSRAQNTFSSVDKPKVGYIKMKKGVNAAKEKFQDGIYPPRLK
jgi:CPA2 family monovalent cation:H+ antiporter-2